MGTSPLKKKTLIKLALKYQYALESHYGPNGLDRLNTNPRFIVKVVVF